MINFLKIHNYEYYKNYPLKNITSIKNDGSTKYFVIVKNIEQLINLYNFINTKKIKYLIIGNGTKLLFINNFKGIIISLKRLNNISLNDYIEVEAGVSILKLNKYLANKNLGGIEALSGIPSFIGSALVNNATAHNVSLYDYLDKVLVFKDELLMLRKEDISYGYRYSSLKEYIVLKAYFKFDESDKKISEDKINKYINYRIENQETKYPNIGSIFKNKENLKAVDILRKCNLENFKYKNVSLSKKHINFINIKGETKGKYIYKFIKKIQKKVKKEININLETEIIIIKS